MKRTPIPTLSPALFLLFITLLHTPHYTRADDDTIPDNNNYRPFYFEQDDIPLVAPVGASDASLTCFLDTTQVSSSFRLEIRHVNAITKKVRAIAELVDLIQSKTSSAVHVQSTEQGYRVESEYVESSTFLKTVVTIDKVSVDDDGKFMCAIISGGNDELTASVTREVIVLKPIDTLSLKLDSHPPITTQPEYPVVVPVTAQKHTVICTAKGSNPATTDIKFFVKDSEVEAKREEPRQVGVEFRMYESSVVASFPITEPVLKTPTIMTLKCMARDNSGNQLSTSLTISLIEPEPEASKCTPIKSEDEKFIIITCLVDRIHRAEITDIQFENGLDGSLFVGSDVTSPQTYTIAGEKTKATLRLSRQRYIDLFQDLNLIVKTAGGRVDREPLRLPNEGDVGRSSDSGISSLSVVVLFSCLLVCWNLA